MKLLTLNTKGIEIEFEAENEDIAPDFDNIEDINAIERDYNNGNIYAWFCAKVTVRYRDYEETDYLGCCSYKSKRDFIENSGYYNDMVNQCIDTINSEIQKHNDSVLRMFKVRQLKRSAEQLGFLIIPKSAIV